MFPILLAIGLSASFASHFPADGAPHTEPGAHPLTSIASPVAPRSDSVETLNDVQGVMRRYVAEARQTGGRYMSHDDIRAARLRVLAELDEAAETIPGDDWILGHRVGMRVKAGRMHDALAVASVDCRGSEWWCRALEGFVLHVQGDSLAAHLAFDDAIERMPAEERCEWQEELGEVLVGALRRPYRGADCEERDELARRVWWLANPFHLLPWNDWRSEHLARVVGMKLHHQSLALIGRLCSIDHHIAVLQRGWPAWWWGYDRDFAPPPPPPSHQFLPPSRAALDPFASEPWDWDLLDDPYREYVDLGYELIHDLEQQTAFFDRGDSLLVVASTEMQRHILRGEARLTAGIALSAGPGTEPFVVREEGPPEHLRFRLAAPRDSYLVSVEAIAHTWGAARSRFGGRLPEPSPAGIALSDLLLFDWADDLDDDLESVFPRMLGTWRIASDRSIGIFWETYGVEEEETLEFSLRVLSTEEGFLRRLGRALRLVGEDAAIRLSWTEPVRGDPASTPGAGSIVGRSLRLGLPGLEPGRYVVELQAAIAERDDEPAVVRRHLEIDWR